MKKPKAIKTKPATDELPDSALDKVAGGTAATPTAFVESSIK